jgi:hypothetical protein
MNALNTISALLSCAFLLSACSSITPVKPWQKGTLAEPVMNPGGLGYETALHNHVYTSKESPKGGEGVAGGGCGCN